MVFATVVENKEKCALARLDCASLDIRLAPLVDIPVPVQSLTFGVSPSRNEHEQACKSIHTLGSFPRLSAANKRGLRRSNMRVYAGYPIGPDVAEILYHEGIRRRFPIPWTLRRRPKQ